MRRCLSSILMRRLAPESALAGKLLVRLGGAFQ